MRLTAILAPLLAASMVVALPNPKAVHTSALNLQGRAATCLPNYQGANLYISSSKSGVRWVVKALKEGSVVKSAKGGKDYWRIEQTGYPQNDFIIKAGRVSDNSLIVTPFKAKNIALTTYQGTNNPSYTIACTFCMDPGMWPASGSQLAKGCTIIDTSTGLYVTETAKGGALARKPKGKAGQKWDMVAV